MISKLQCGIGNSTGADLVGAVNGLLERSSRGLTKAPNVLIDPTHPDFSYEDVSSTAPELIELAECPFNGKIGLHIVTAVGASASIRFPQLFGVQFFNEAYVSSYETPIPGKQQTFQLRVYDGSSEFWNYQNILSVSSVNGGDYTGGPQTRFYNDSHRVAQGSPSATPFIATDNRLIILSVAGEQVETWIFGIGFGQKRKSRICVVWDDNKLGAAINGIPLLNSKGIKSNVGLITDKVGDSDYMGINHLLSHVNSGGAVVPHGPSRHGQGFDDQASPNLIDAYANADNPIKSAIDDIEYTQNYILENGLGDDIDNACFVYPQGVYQTDVGDTSLLAAMHEIGIRVGRISFMQGDPNDPGSGAPYKSARPHRNVDAHSKLGKLACTTVGHEWAGSDAAEAANIAQVVERINTCAIIGVDCFLMLHDCVPSSTPQENMDTYDIRVSDLETIADAIAANVASGDQEVVLMRDFVNLRRSFWGEV